MADSFPRYRAAAVQMAPVWMDRDATTEKIVWRRCYVRVYGACR